LAWILADVAEVHDHMPKVATCLRAVDDPFPGEGMRVSYLVHDTLFKIPTGTNTDTEPVTNLITSFKPDDGRLFIVIRGCTLFRSDGVNVLKGVMKKSPELITDDLYQAG